jgi:hypothetical protein
MENYTGKFSGDFGTRAPNKIKNIIKEDCCGTISGRKEKNY